jgi:uncharacterized membrane protein
MNSKTERIISLDALRGLMIVLMALDHANYFVAGKHPPGEHWGGSFPIYHDALTFLTRWVTHLAAPGFAFLMGVGMYLFYRSRQQRDWSLWAVQSHFIVRGMILILLQILIINRAWQLGPELFPRLYLGVLVALGGGLILGSFFLSLKPLHLIIITAMLVIGTELTHPAPWQWGLNDPLGLLFTYSGGNLELWSNYPILPWLELITFGLLFGYWLAEDDAGVYQRARWLGLLCLGAFIIIRAVDGFGNVRPRAGDQWIDFLNVVKYPPSLVFTLMTMGINLLILSTFHWARERATWLLQLLATYGKTPLFFYILHLFLYALLGRWLTPQGTSIPAMYPYWILGLIILYPLCWWYARLKSQQPPNSLLRFL